MASHPDTPMMKQYFEIKKDYPDTILFFRMGDFYEMFFEDARIAADVLQIALTERQKGVPMAGIPFHAMDPYLNKFVTAGHKIAICEQLETKPEKGNKIVRREVVRVVTPGTHIRDDALSSFLISLYWDKQIAAGVVLDFTSGESVLYQKKIDKNPEKLKAFLQSLLVEYGQSEFLLFPQADKSITQTKNSQAYNLQEFLNKEGALVNILDGWVYDPSLAERIIKEFFNILQIENLWSIPESEVTVPKIALGALLHYVQTMQKGNLRHIRLPRLVHEDSLLRLDESAIRSLELIANENEGTVRGSLYAVLDQCKTAMGKRRLKDAILHPLTDLDLVQERLSIVEFLVQNERGREELRNLLADIRDIEKILSKLSTNRAVPADLGALRDSLMHSKELVQHSIIQKSPMQGKFLGKETFDFCLLLEAQLRMQLQERLPLNFDGAIIAAGVDKEVDRLRNISQGGKDWILEYQEAERKKTGIATLKVKYNRVFGYFIEISKGQSSAAPPHYQRKQTLVNAERFTTDPLKEFEREILTADDQLAALERDLFQKIVTKILENSAQIQALADFIGFLDLFAALAQRAVKSNYCRPRLIQEPFLRIVEGRHPVVEQYLDAGQFVANDLNMDGDEKSIAIITGPNMAGKSTFIRQSALICLMAQMGSFVPAQEAVIGITDQIFTRIGASDNLARGQSTFLLEMQETASILHHFTERSLIILDEVGRGTSTYDGMSIAWSVIEYLARGKEKPRTLFATHYHELTTLSARNGIFNLTLLVEENQKQVSFLRRVVPGAADRSYGIHVAQLAGIPSLVLRRAQQILQHLESSSSDENQLQLFEAQVNFDENTFFQEEMPDKGDMNYGSIPDDPRFAWITALQEMDLDSITPMQALQILQDWQKALYSAKEKL